jgi:hypothetical protein
MRTLIIAVLVAIPATGQTQDLERARRLYLGADLEGARREARGVLEKNVAEDQAALRLLVVASCRLKDVADARRAFSRLTTLNQCLALAACARAGVRIGPDPAGACATSQAGPPPEAVDAAPPPDPRRPWRIATWSVGGTALASLALAIGFAVKTRSLQHEKDELLVRHAMEVGDTSWIHAADACAAAESVGAGDVVDRCNSGKRFAAATNAMYGVTAGLVLLTGYLYYRGYIREERPVVQVQPGLAARGGGISLSAAF